MIQPLKESIKITADGDIAWVDFDLPNEKINKLSGAVLMRLKEVVAEIKQSKFKTVIFSSMKNKIFIAGADIQEIKLLKTQADIKAAVEIGQSIMNEVEDLPQVTIASVNGACMGGGCEFILACDYRIASEDPSTKIGLPETQLGIIPGFGGCVRMPRVVGLPTALDIILAGKAYAATKAFKVGLVDRVVHPNLLRQETKKWAQTLTAKRRKVYQPKDFMSKVLDSGLGRGIVFKKARQGVIKATRGQYPAPLKALEVIANTYKMQDRNKALEIEKQGFVLCAVTDISKNLIHVYELTERVKKQTGVPGIKGKDVTHLGLLGAGTMGGGIAFVSADKGIEVRVKDLSIQALGNSLKHARELFSKNLKRKSINTYQLKQKMDLITTTTDYSGFGRLDLVVEAIVEDMEIKKKVIAETAGQMRPDAIIATNTSSLSVSEMSKGHPRPEFFAGMHFFNPVNRMPLVEVIRGDKTSDQTTATVFELAKKMGKMPVVVKDGPGFLVNRLLLPYMAEAAFLLQEGMSGDRIDDLYVKFGMPMGPVALMDEVGLDVCVKVLKIFQKAYSDRMEIPPLFDALAKSERKGKKNGKGFYKYSADGRRLEYDPTILNELGLPMPTNRYSDAECVERGVYGMINEAARALFDDRIVESAHEVDLAMIMGTGFPPFRGGLLRYADSVGMKPIVTALEKYSRERKAKRLIPAPALIKTTTFYK